MIYLLQKGLKMSWTTTTNTNFKISDKVKIVNSADKCFLNKIFTVCNTFTINDLLHGTSQSYVTVEENTYHWNMKDLVLFNNTILEIE
jgi:hypothetical protein